MKPVPALSLLTIAFTLAFPLSSLHAANPECLYADSDSDGDGWGWENNQSCVVSSDSARRSVVTTEEPAPGRPAATTRPVCSSASADPDGDGWGWENNDSCIVADTSEAETIETAEATPVVLTPVAPRTAAALSTPEPQEPEVTEPAATEAATTDTDIINGLYRGRHPICSSPSSDADGDGWGYEFNGSCKVVEGYIAPRSAPDTPPAGNDKNIQAGVIYTQTFNTSNVGLYQADQLNSDWQSPFWNLGFDEGRVRIVQTGDRGYGKAMEVTYPAGSYGAGGSSSFLSDVQFGMGLPKSYEELYVAYDLRFAVGFDFVRGGKLPGLCGADINAAPSTGCNTGGGYPTGYDGWSARGMWRENGELENYIYHASQRNYYGDDEFWRVAATPGQWHRVEHRVVLNTPGQRNGILEAWFDGRKVLSLNNIEYRKTDTIGINLFYFSTFFGGNDISWAPSTDQTMNFDNFVISTEKID